MKRTLSALLLTLLAGSVSAFPLTKTPTPTPFITPTVTRTPTLTPTQTSIPTAIPIPTQRIWIDNFLGTLTSPTTVSGGYLPYASGSNQLSNTDVLFFGNVLYPPMLGITNVLGAAGSTVISFDGGKMVIGDGLNPTVFNSPSSFIGPLSTGDSPATFIPAIGVTLITKGRLLYSINSTPTSL